PVTVPPLVGGLQLRHANPLPHHVGLPLPLRQNLNGVTRDPGFTQLPECPAQPGGADFLKYGEAAAGRLGPAHSVGLFDESEPRLAVFDQRVFRGLQFGVGAPVGRVPWGETALALVAFPPPRVTVPEDKGEQQFIPATGIVRQVADAEAVLPDAPAEIKAGSPSRFGSHEKVMLAATS